MRKYSAVLFDLDGTLIDPGKGIMGCVAHAIDTLGLPALTEAALRSFVGPPLRGSFAALGLDPEDCERAVAAYRDRYVDTGIYECSLVPGIPGVLNALQDQGRALAVATSKPTIFAERVLAHFDLARHFDAVCGATLDGTVATKADAVARAIIRLGNPRAEHAVLVGDRDLDVVGARDVGLDCIGVNWGYGAEGELAAAGPLCVVDSPAELLAVLTASSG